jgi:hypothetical protein
MKIDDVARAMDDILAVAGPDETVANEAFEKLQKRVGLELGLSGQALTNVMTDAKLMIAALTLSGCAHKSLIQEKTDELVGQIRAPGPSRPINSGT